MRASTKKSSMTLLWRHNGRDCASYHQSNDCSLNRSFRRRSKKISKLRVTGLCAGIHRSPVNSPNKRPVTRKMLLFDDVIMIKFYILQLVYVIPVEHIPSFFTFDPSTCLIKTRGGKTKTLIIPIPSFSCQVIYIVYSNIRTFSRKY